MKGFTGENDFEIAEFESHVPVFAGGAERNLGFQPDDIILLCAEEVFTSLILICSHFSTLFLTYS